MLHDPRGGKQPVAEPPSGTAAIAHGQTQAAADPLAGVNSLITGRGRTLAAPSTDALLAAVSLLGNGSPEASDALQSSLPVGSAWPVLRIVTPEGLQTHSVEPTAVDVAGSRGELAGGLAGGRLLDAHYGYLFLRFTHA
jgi:hypothetical protein